MNPVDVKPRHTWKDQTGYAADWVPYWFIAFFAITFIAQQALVASQYISTLFSWVLSPFAAAMIIISAWLIWDHVQRRALRFGNNVPPGEVNRSTSTGAWPKGDWPILIWTDEAPTGKTRGMARERREIADLALGTIVMGAIGWYVLSVVGAIVGAFIGFKLSRYFQSDRWVRLLRPHARGRTDMERTDDLVITGYIGCAAFIEVRDGEFVLVIQRGCDRFKSDCESRIPWDSFTNFAEVDYWSRFGRADQTWPSPTRAIAVTPRHGQEILVAHSADNAFLQRLREALEKDFVIGRDGPRGLLAAKAAMAQPKAQSARPPLSDPSEIPQSI